MSNIKQPKIGDTIIYQAFGGIRRKVTVIGIAEDIKNGRPGFDGLLESGDEVWGYTDQIVEGASE